MTNDVPFELYRIELFGQIRLLAGQRMVARIAPSKPGVLLGYLAVHRQRPQYRGELIEQFWPETDQVSGQNRLKQALCALRRGLQRQHPGCETILVADRTVIGISQKVSGTDVADFEEAVRFTALASSFPDQILRLDEAARLYGGDFLAGCYDDWVLRERNRLSNMYAEVLARLTTALERIGEPERALSYAVRAVEADPFREEVHGAIIRIHLALGRRPEALRQYREMERLFARELGAEPSAQSKALYERAKNADQQPAKHCAAPGGDREAPSLEPVGGALPLESNVYITRPTDTAFRAALIRQESIVLVKGPRQVGKTSLLVRGAQEARALGARVVTSDLQKMNTSQFESVEWFYLACARSIADQLGLAVLPDDAWDTRRGANDNFERYLRRNVLGSTEGLLVWCIDEVDRIFSREYSTEVFSLFRSWHNERSLDPSGPWSRLTLTIAYATEAHLFIRDLNQSPFNVGTRLSLEDFTLEQVADLNRRYGSPLSSVSDIARLFQNVGGNPYLCQRSFYELTKSALSLDAFLAEAERENGPFHDQLHRLKELLSEDAELAHAVRAILQGKACPSIEAFYRLRSAGVISGEHVEEARMRCELYARYLKAYFR
jgi:DNA-binding SARP family transcriptional activator